MNKVTLEERVKKLEQEVAKLKAEKLQLEGLKIGDCFELAGVKWKILDITSRGYHCLAETMSSRKVFDASANNWSDSNFRKWLNDEFFDTLCEEI